MSGNDERPLRLPKSPVPRPSPQGTPEALPYPSLRRLSSTSQRHAAPRSAARGRPGDNAFWNSYTSVLRSAAGLAAGHPWAPGVGAKIYP